MSTANLTTGETFETTDKGRKIVGVITSVQFMDAAARFLPGGAAITVKSARREYGIFVRADGTSWVAC